MIAPSSGSIYTTRLQTATFKSWSKVVSAINSKIIAWRSCHFWRLAWCLIQLRGHHPHSYWHIRCWRIKIICTKRRAVSTQNTYSNWHDCRCLISLATWTHSLDRCKVEHSQNCQLLSELIIDHKLGRLNRSLKCSGWVYRLSLHNMYNLRSKSTKSQRNSSTFQTS